MSSNFLPKVDIEQLRVAYAAAQYDEVYELLAQPLHEELYRRQTFDFIDELSTGQQMLLAYDYLRTQVGQGGFIQFIENGYIPLLPTLIEQLSALQAKYMAQVLDDALKVYVLNHDLFLEAHSLADFARLYEELKEFEGIDKRFQELNVPTMKFMLLHAMGNLAEFVAMER